MFFDKFRTFEEECRRKTKGPPTAGQAFVTLLTTENCTVLPLVIAKAANL
jgi:hypothetical protein